jgi:hypothetical protein
MKDLVNLESGATVLAAVPTADTLQRLQEIFGGSPIAINWDLLCLRLAESETPANWRTQDDTYFVDFTEFGIMYDEELGHTQLIGRVSSPVVRERARACGMSADFTPSVVFTDNAQMARSNKSFITSVSTTLVTRQTKPFTFGPETIITG